MKFNKPGGYLKTIFLLLIIQWHQCLRQNAPGVKQTGAEHKKPRRNTWFCPESLQTARKCKKPDGRVILPHRNATIPRGNAKNQTEMPKTAQKYKKPAGNGIEPGKMVFPCGLCLSKPVFWVFARNFNGNFVFPVLRYKPLRFSKPQRFEGQIL